jgi:hypothetical protein
MLGWSWQLKVEFQCFTKIAQRFVLGFSVTGDIDFQTLGDIPVAFMPNTCSKVLFHRKIGLDTHPVYGIGRKARSFLLASFPFRGECQPITMD